MSIFASDEGTEQSAPVASAFIISQLAIHTYLQVARTIIKLKKFKPVTWLVSRSISSLKHKYKF